MQRERLFTKDFILDTAISLCCSLNYFTLLINITGYAMLTFGATSTEAGLAAGIYVIGGLISRVTLGKYVEMVGRKRMLMLGLTIALVMSVTYFFVSSMAMLYIIPPNIFQLPFTFTGMPPFDAPSHPFSQSPAFTSSMRAIIIPANCFNTFPFCSVSFITVCFLILDIYVYSAHHLNVDVSNVNQIRCSQVLG